MRELFGGTWIPAPTCVVLDDARVRRAERASGERKVLRRKRTYLAEHWCLLQDRNSVSSSRDTNCCCETAEACSDNGDMDGWFLLSCHFEGCGDCFGEHTVEIRCEALYAER